MRRAHELNAGLAHDTSGQAPSVISSQCRELAGWAEHGGVLPARLAAHAGRCPRCADRVRLVNEVNAGLTLLRTQSLPANLHARANGRALRMLRRVARASSAAARLLAMRPHLSPWRRAQLHVMRVSLSGAAAVLALCARAGVNAGFDRTRDLGQQLASAHWERHIDPNHEWFEPPPTA